jgi:hypothetical protein
MGRLMTIRRSLAYEALLGGFCAITLVGATEIHARADAGSHLFPAWSKPYAVRVPIAPRGTAAVRSLAQGAGRTPASDAVPKTSNYLSSAGLEAIGTAVLRTDLLSLAGSLRSEALAISQWPTEQRPESEGMSAAAPGFNAELLVTSTGWAGGLQAPRISYEPVDLDWAGQSGLIAAVRAAAHRVGGEAGNREHKFPLPDDAPPRDAAAARITIAPQERRQAQQSGGRVRKTGSDSTPVDLNPVGSFQHTFLSGPAVFHDATAAGFGVEPALGQMAGPQNLAASQLPVSSQVHLAADVSVREPIQSVLRQDTSRLPESRDVIEHNADTVLHLGAIADLPRDTISAEERDRISSLPAASELYSLEAVPAAGIPVRYDTSGGHLQLIAAAAQPASASGNAGVGVGDGSLSSAATGLRYNLAATASAGYDTSPFLFLQQGGDTEAASVRLQLAPSISQSGARNSFRLSGRAEHVEFSRRYGSFQNFGADLVTTNRLTERLQANTGLTFVSDIPGANLANPVFDAPVLDGEVISPGLPGLPVGNDITLLGQLQRRTLYGGNAGLNYQLNEREELRWSVAFSANRFGLEGFADSDFASQQISYSRQINSRLNLGALVDASIINFSDEAFGNVRTVSPQILLTTQLSDWFEANGSIGVAIARIESPLGNETNTFMSGNLSLCYKRPTNTLCLAGSRQVLPAGIGGALVQTTGGISYSARLSERETIQFGGNYGRASQPFGDFGGFESINGFARYERQIRERVRFFANGGYQQVTDNRSVEASNIQGSIGISINYGNTR